MLYNKIILVPYKKRNSTSEIEWFIQIDKHMKTKFEIGPFKSELIAGKFMENIEIRYDKFIKQLINFAGED